VIRLASLALLAAVFAPGWYAKDEQRLALLRQAQDSFDRVQKAISPQLPEASACVRRKPR